MNVIFQRSAVTLLALISFQFFIIGGTMAMSRKLDTTEAVYYSCTAKNNPNAEQVLCRAVESHLKANGQNATKAQFNSESGLHMEFILDVVSKSFLAGRLNWIECKNGVCSKTYKGSPIEVSVMDATVSDKSYQSLLKGLITISKPPL